MFSMRKVALVMALTLVASCGGGSGGVAPAGGSPSATNFSGVAVDGYLYLARAFLDLNGNGQYDSDEPTAITNENGVFTLTATQDQINSYSVVVIAIAGTTIDQDYPNTPLASGMTLFAPAGNPSVVSPLTTLVSAKMAGGLSLADAKSAVQTELGLSNIDVMKNFVVEKVTNTLYENVHKAAVSVAEVLKNIEAQSSTNTTLANRFSSLVSTVTSQVAPNLNQIKAATSVDDAKTVITTVISQSVNIYNIGGSISGLTASGLVLANGVSIVSPNSGANSFTFSSRKASGAAYAVTVQSNPTGQVCSILNGTGTVGSQSITNVSISCSNTPGALGGTISGLTTTGLILKNGSDELNVASGSSTFQFSSTVADGFAYAVAIKTQPIGKTCSVSNSTGIMASAGATNVQITCSSNSYSISGSISGLTTSGLKLKNGSEVLAVSSGATTFSLSNTVAFGGVYSVSVDTQPTGQICSLSNSSGTMGANNVTSVQLACAVNSFSISGSISGLVSSGLKLKNGSDLLTVSSGATNFILNSQVAYGGSYSVTVDTQPIGLTCVASSSSGIASDNVTGIQVACGKVLDVSVTGYFGTSNVHYAPYYSNAYNINDTSLNLVVTDQYQSITITPASVTANFSKFYNLNSSYSISVTTSPDGYFCTPQNGSGIINANTNSTINVNCQPTSGTVVSIAGNSTQATTSVYNNGFGFTDANGWDARLNRPSGIAVHPNGSLYVADTYNGVIRKIDTNGDVTSIGLNYFTMPYGIVYHPRGYFLVSDILRNQIYKMDAISHKLSLFAGRGIQGSIDNPSNEARFFGPRGLAVTNRGDVMVADSGNHRIRRISLEGYVSTYAGPGTGRPYGGSNVTYGFVNGNAHTAMFNMPWDLAIDANDNVYVADSGNYSIRKITRSTDQVSTFAGSSSSCSMIYNSDCNGTGINAGFHHPVGIAIDNDGNILVADNNRVRKINPSGLVSTLAGGGGSNLAGFIDGPSSKAAFSRPTGLAVDTTGNIFVADTFNHSIRKIKK